MNLSDRLFGQFSELIYRECGISLHEGKKALLQARLNKRLRATGQSSYDNYYHYLVSHSDPQEIVHFLDCVSTNLTYFFREPQHFEFLAQLLPDLLASKRKQGSNRLRVWSAGCSTGEEPYSIAMSILPQLGDIRQWDCRILATDISTRVLSVAATGVYGEEKINKIQADLRSAFFRKVEMNGGGAVNYEVAPALRSVITFRRLNLQEPYPFKGPFDFVFCRNVMIYFDKKTQEALIEKMSYYLPAGGCLFVGHSESLMGLSHSLSYVRPAIYRK